MTDSQPLRSGCEGHFTSLSSQQLEGKLVSHIPVLCPKNPGHTVTQGTCQLALHEHTGSEPPLLNPAAFAEFNYYKLTLKTRGKLTCWRTPAFSA